MKRLEETEKIIFIYFYIKYPKYFSKKLIKIIQEIAYILFHTKALRSSVNFILTATSQFRLATFHLFDSHME